MRQCRQVGTCRSSPSQAAWQTLQGQPHNFTGPGTKLDRRLNPDGTPRYWSKPINRVDEAAYHLDLCYAKNPDTRTRNEVCDLEMLQELAQITNPSLRERMERGLVGSMTKANLGLGL